MRVLEGSTILDACRRARDRHADALLRRHADAGERLPRLRRRARRRARRSCRPARARSRRAWSCTPTPSACARAAGSCSSCSARRSTSRLAPEALALHRALRRAARALRRRRGDGRAAGEDRQRPLRARLLAAASSVTSASRPAATTHQNTFAIAVAGRGFDAHISTELDVPLPESACVYCGNCIAVCPTGALMSKSEYDLPRGRHVGRGGADRGRHDLPVLRRRLQPHAARAGRRDRQGHVARRPRRDARQPLHQGPLRLRLRAEPQAATVTIELGSLAELEPALAKEEFEVARVFVGYGACAPSAPEPCPLPKVAYSLAPPESSTGSFRTGSGRRRGARPLCRRDRHRS